jgi:photosystem II stability/assembly factor-like uncharacterized protein
MQTMVKERARVKRGRPMAKSDWKSIGPTNIGGRMTSIVCDPRNPDRIWAGAAGGGVWQSDNAGQNWKSLWHDQDSLNVGSLAIDQQKPDVLYCGTGEANLSADSNPGVGIYKTTDGGKSWKLLASSFKTKIPTRIGVIVIDPFDSKHLRIGGIGFGEASPRENDFGGMYFSRDGGETWRREVFVSTNNYWCHAIVFHPTRQGVILATFTEHGAKNGIWLSEDGGKNWTQLTEGLPTSDYFGRTSLAMSTSNPDVVYACAAGAQSDYLLGVFRSSDGGKVWQEIGGYHYFAAEGQISYGNTIVVHPTNPDYVICGGIDLHLTGNAGEKWTQITQWNADRKAANYAHADHHCLLMPAAAPGRIYDINDGGLDVSEDGGETWSNRSKGLAITMYYDMDVAQIDGKQFGGGAQDNGTLVTIDDGTEYKEISGGDGGWMVYDPTDAGHLYVSSQHMRISRRRDHYNVDVSPPADQSELPWMAYVTIDPQDPNTVLAGSRRIWRTKNDAQSWAAVSGYLDGSPISAIEITPADSKRIYVGTENGGFFRSLDGGDSWSADLSGATLPGHQITRIDSTRANVDLLVVTIGNYYHSHVFRSKDGGSSWEDVDKGQLPDVPHHAVVIRPDKPETIYVANDVGVFVSDDSAKTWMNMTGSLPNVMVVDLVLHEKDGTLSAATYGRSLWRTKIR